MGNSVMGDAELFQELGQGYGNQKRNDQRISWKIMASTGKKL
jgi:hypothetical protein